ncbi:hypothetical protein VTO73DRAFT_10708 [Trametes versicolor]
MPHRNSHSGRILSWIHIRETPVQLLFLLSQLLFLLAGQVLALIPSIIITSNTSGSYCQKSPVNHSSKNFRSRIYHKTLTMAQTSMLGRTAPVHSLPVEILLEAFAYVAEPASNCPSLPSGAEARARQRTQLMPVCQHWRTIITGASRFWTSIDFSHDLKWVELCLHRSKKSSIDVRLVGLSCASLRTATPLILAARARIRSLTFQSNLKTISGAMLQQLFSAPMPALEKLSVSLDWQDSEHGSSKVDLRLSAENHPRLRSLSVRGAVLPIEPSHIFYPHLVHILREAAQAPPLPDIDLSNLLRLTMLTTIFSEGIIAPHPESAWRALLSACPNLRTLAVSELSSTTIPRSHSDCGHNTHPMSGPVRAVHNVARLHGL